MDQRGNRWAFQKPTVDPKFFIAGSLVRHVKPTRDRRCDKDVEKFNSLGCLVPDQMTVRRGGTE